VVAAARKFQVLAVNHLEGLVLGSPAISSGQIFLRTDGHLFAIGEPRHRRPAWDRLPAEQDDQAKQRRAASGQGEAGPAGS
jgi:hypothetical protein